MTTDDHLVRGRHAEDLASRHLESAGLSLLVRNYRAPCGEIDIVMRDGETLVFVEVRFRSSVNFGTAEESVDSRKQHRIRQTADHFLQKHRKYSNSPCRFDIVALCGSPHSPAVNWLRNAF